MTGPFLDVDDIIMSTDRQMSFLFDFQCGVGMETIKNGKKIKSWTMFLHHVTRGKSIKHRNIMYLDVPITLL